MVSTSQIVAISDNANTLTGLALAGIIIKPAHSPDELLAVLEDMATGTALIIVTAGLAAKSTGILSQFRGKTLIPLVSIIPEPGFDDLVRSDFLSKEPCENEP